MRDPQANDRYRYAHFVAPDGELYELVEETGPRDRAEQLSAWR